MKRKQYGKKNTGLIYVFTGEGKGKTSASLGTAVRAVGAGLQVAWVAWYKQSSWGISEYTLTELLPKELFSMHLLGKGFHIDQSHDITPKNDGIKIAPIKGGAKVIDAATEKEHKEAAEQALRTAKDLIKKSQVLVLDEINNAIDDGLVDIDGVLELLAIRGKTHVVLSGRNAHKKLIEEADLVSEITKVKHPYDQGLLAVKGLDF